MRRLLLGLLLLVAALPVLGGCSTGCDLTPPPGDEVVIRAQLVGFAGQTLRVVRLPDEVLGQVQDIDLSFATTTLPNPDTASDESGGSGSGAEISDGASDGGSILDGASDAPSDETPFDPDAVNPEDIIEISLLGSANNLDVGGTYEITAYSDADGIVAVLENGCRGADTVKQLDGTNIAGWGVGFGTILTVGLSILVPMLAVIGAVYVARFMVGRRKGPDLKPGRL